MDVMIAFKSGPLLRDLGVFKSLHKKIMNPEPGFQSGPGDSVDAD